MSKMALDGVKVLDFTSAMSGPMTTKYLADFGATVVRVESRTRPDLIRWSTPYKDGIPGLDRSSVFALCNPNKYSVSINMKKVKGQEIARSLVGWADVVIENLTPGVMERWGLSFEELKKIKPDVILLRSSAQGQTGPHARVPCYGYNLVGLAGFTNLTGWPDREPVQPYGVYTDFSAFPFAVAAVMAALDYRRRTGKEKYLDVSQFEICTQLLAPLILDYFLNQKDATRAGNVCAFAVPHGAFRCRGSDRWCAIAVFTEKQWQAFCKAAGHPEWQNDTRFFTLLARKSNEDELDRLIEGWTVNLSAEDVMNVLQGVGVPAGVLETPEDVFNDPQLRHRDNWWTLPNEVLGPFPHLGQPCSLSETPAQGRLPSARLGEHTELVCREILGMSDNEFVELINEGVLE